MFVIVLVNFCVMGIKSILCGVNEINLMYSELDLCFSCVMDEHIEHVCSCNLKFILGVIGEGVEAFL